MTERVPTKIRVTVETCGRCAGLGWIPLGLVNAERSAALKDKSGATVALAVGSPVAVQTCPACQGQPPFNVTGRLA